MTVSVEKINRFKNVLLFESLKLKEKTCIFTTWLGLLKQVNEYSYISAMNVGREKKVYHVTATQALVSMINKRNTFYSFSMALSGCRFFFLEISKR